MAPKQGNEVLRVTLARDLIRKLRVLAAEKGSPVRTHIAEALTRYLNDLEQKTDG
jgi:cytosine/adenosine deaminase-related metal-dependent hydrolase